MIVNLRDLGGYEVDGGKCVKTCLLIRSAHLADASDADIAYLESLPVTMVVDFRTEVDLKGPMGLTDDDIRILRKRYLSPAKRPVDMHKK